MDGQLKRGLLDVCVLAAIKSKDSYGYQIIKDMKPYLVLSESTLYTILKRLEAANMLTVRTAEHGGRLYPKLRETLVELRRSYALIIVSNCQDGYIQDFLDFADMRGLFGDFESAGGTGLSKGENIKLVIERNSIDKAVYVGDTQGDLDSADFAGIPFIRAAYGFGQMNRPVPEIREFCELPEKAAEII